MVFNLLTIYKGQKPGFLSSKWVWAESRIHVNNIKASILRVSARHHATADVAVRALFPRHEGRKPRAESRARCPNPGFLPNRTLAMSRRQLALGRWRLELGLWPTVTPTPPRLAQWPAGPALRQPESQGRPESAQAPSPESQLAARPRAAAAADLSKRTQASRCAAGPGTCMHAGAELC